MDYINIIKTDIVSNQYDILWEDISPITGSMEPRPLLVVVNECEPGSAEDQQLQKMLDACKLYPEQYNILRLQSGQQIAWHQLRERLNPAIVFLIGVMPAQLGVSAFFKLNETNNFNDRIWLPTLDLRVLAKHEDLRKQLWINSMKPLLADNPLPAMP